VSPSRELLEVGGRRLEVEVSGPHGREALIFHTGTPSAGVLFGPMIEAGAQRGIRHIAYSRPGYARSDRHAGRSVGDCVEDVAAITEGLGIERFFTVGWSGGGPHALACAALLPDRVIAAATIASVAPRQAEGLDWMAGMGEDNVTEFTAAEAGELLSFLEQHAGAIKRATGAQLHEVLRSLLSDVDVAALTGEYADYLANATALGLSSGIWGWADDDVAFMRDWGFDLGAISRPVTIWQGQQDLMVPFAHGQWLASHVSGARAELLSDDGHLSLMLGSYDRVLDDLLARAG
jgi:pimeloyl-ACP methyl ester carboxylesterase